MSEQLEEELVRHLLSKISDLEKQLDHEIEVNTKLSDTNIFLKKEVAYLQVKTKLVAHPSTIATLTAGMQGYEARNIKLRESLVVAISLIPDNSHNKFQLEHLRRVVNSF